MLAGAARQRTDRLTYQMDFPVPLGQIAQIAVLAIFGIIAAAEIGISTAVLLVLIGVLLAAVAGTFTLAFGLGSREVARALSAGRYLRHDYRVGQEIAFGEVRGRITRIHSTSTTARRRRGPVDPRSRTTCSSTASSRSTPMRSAATRGRRSEGAPRRTALAQCAASCARRGSFQPGRTKWQV